MNLEFDNVVLILCSYDEGFNDTIALVCCTCGSLRSSMICLSDIGGKWKQAFDLGLAVSICWSHSLSCTWNEEQKISQIRNLWTHKSTGEGVLGQIWCYLRSASMYISTKQLVGAMCLVPSWWTLSQDWRVKMIDNVVACCCIIAVLWLLYQPWSIDW